MYKSVNKTKDLRRYMKSLALHINAPTVYWEGNKSCISFVESEIVTPGFKHIEIPVCFLLEQFDNVIFVPKYENSSVIPADM